ncbi:hypothetical protein ScalyP_jg12127 [Parmales sp. scaly parma]|nr:hypothetical protein ScalyP_jg12127 [Parmales sp. scaly parma]
MTSIIDLEGLTWKSAFNGADGIEFLKKLVRILSEHYPQRSARTYILNAPKWFNSIFKLIKPLLREKTKKKIEIFGAGKKEEEKVWARLKDVLGEQIANNVITGGGQDEKDLREFCLRGLREEKMETIGEELSRVRACADQAIVKENDKRSKKRWFI